jgi:hypothetical protein
LLREGQCDYPHGLLPSERWQLMSPCGAHGFTQNVVPMDSPKNVVPMNLWFLILTPGYYFWLLDTDLDSWNVWETPRLCGRFQIVWEISYRFGLEKLVCPISDKPESTLAVHFELKVHRFSFRWAEWGVKTCSRLTCIYYTYPEFFRQFLEVHFFYRTFLLFVASPLFPYFGVQRRKPTGCYMFGLKFST